jgi:hypothetical protein
MPKYVITHKEIGSAEITAGSKDQARDAARPHIALRLDRVVEDHEILVEEAKSDKDG